MSEARGEPPLQGFFSQRRESANESPGVVLAERSFFGYVNLRGDQTDVSFVGAVSRVLGVALPTIPNTLIENDHLTVCWLGPDEWMVIVRPEGETELATALRVALGGLHAAVSDTTGGYTTVNLAGSRARDLLAKGCTLDLHPRVLSPGQCAQTNLAKTSVLLLPRVNHPGAQSFDVVVRRSFADYLAHWFEHSAREYGLELRSEPT